MLPVADRARGVVRLAGLAVALCAPPWAAPAQASSFAAARALATTPNPTDVVTADFNGDGAADLAMVDLSGPIEIFLGDGHGDFSSAGSHTGGFYRLAVGDFNGDKLLDLIAYSDNGRALFFGNGAGGFSRGPDVHIDPNSQTRVADFNGDGRDDLAVLDSSNRLSILLGDGHGGFRERSALAIGSNATGFAVGRLNGDASPDVVVATADNASLTIVLGDGHGGIASVTQRALPDSPGAVLICDLNEDGKADLAVEMLPGVAILLGNGAGGFGPVARYPVLAGGLLTAGDFGGDGHIDIVFGGNMSDIAVLPGDGTGWFGQPARTFSAGQSPVTATAADFDGDGLLDLAAANANGGFVSLLLGEGEGALRAPRSISLEAYGPLAIGGPDGDGTTYVAAAGGPVPGVSLFQGDHEAQLSALSRLPAGGGQAAFADFNGDGKLDVAVTNESSGSVATFLGAGAGSFGPRVDYPAGPQPGAIASADLNGDGYTDLVVGHPTGASRVTVLLGDGGGGFGSPVGYDAAAGGSDGVLVGDINGDGHPDVVAFSGRYFVVDVMLGDGAGGLALASSTNLGSWVAGVALGDFDGDHHLDVAVALFGQTAIRLLRGDGSGLLLPPTLLESGISLNLIAAADFDGDTRSDLLVGGISSRTVAVLEADSSGQLASVKTFDVGMLPTSLATGDVDGNGRPDFAVTTLLGRLLVVPDVAIADLVVTIDDAAEVAFVGRTLTYTVEARNEGPDDILSARITDRLPSGLAGAIWSCAPSGGASCATGGVGSIDDVVGLPVGGSATYSLSAVVTATAGGAIIYTARARLPPRGQDPSPSNNSATDRDEVPIFSLKNAIVMEGNAGSKALNLLVGLQSSYREAVSVHYTTRDGTARGGYDYLPRTGTLVFAPGQRFKQVVVPIVGDRVPEGMEHFFVELAAASVAGHPPRARITIVDDDGPGAPRER